MRAQALLLRHLFDAAAQQLDVIPLEHTTLVPPFGPAGAATFTLDIESGVQASYTYATDVMKSTTGVENRVRVEPYPRTRVEFSTLISPDQARNIRSQLVRAAPAASVFYVGLTFEAISLTAVSTGTVLAVTTTTFADWALPGQRCAVVGADGTTAVPVTIQSVDATTVTVDVAVGSLGAVAGALLVPLLPVYLDDTQSFGSWPVNLERWDVKGVSPQFGWCGSQVVGRGATITMFDGLPVWDLALGADDLVPGSIVTGSERVDFGLGFFDVGYWTTSDWGRAIRLVFTRDAVRQYVRLFYATTFGRQKTFLLPTWKPDLEVISSGGGLLVVKGPPTVLSDYVTNWFPSLAHRRLMFQMADGSVNYAVVSFAFDNGNGTQTLALPAGSPAGTIVTASFLETCRFDDDALTLTYSDGNVGRTDLAARVVQR